MMTDTEEVPTEVIALHNDMVDKLGSEIGPEDDIFPRLIGLFNGIPLTSSDKKGIKNMLDLIAILMKYETINYGEYTALTDKLEKTHKRMKTLVISYTKEMKIVWKQAKGENCDLSQETITDQDTASDGPDGFAVLDTKYYPKTDREWQLYLDRISDKITTDISTVATCLRVSSDKQTQINKDNNTEHEKCFQILWEWYRTTQETGKIDAFRDALVSAGRKDITDDDMPRTGTYSDALPSRETPVTAIDMQNVSKHIGANYPSLARYYGLSESDIHASKHDKKDKIQEQARDVLQKCFNQTLLKTRQQLCEGLLYKDRRDIIIKLVEGWQVSK